MKVIEEPNAWKYFTIVFHWRNCDEGGWLNANNTPASQAAQHFWNESHGDVVDLDNEFIKNGWQIVEPRDPSCIKIESVRNAKGQNAGMVAIGAVFTMGLSLIPAAIGFYKWWPSSLTLRWRKQAESDDEKIINLWMDPNNNNEFERFEFDLETKKWIKMDDWEIPE